VIMQYSHTLIALGLLSELRKVDRVLVAHCGGCSKVCGYTC
jgi:hypothetical protein